MRGRRGPWITLAASAVVIVLGVVLAVVLTGNHSGNDSGSGSADRSGGGVPRAAGPSTAAPPLTSADPTPTTVATAPSTSSTRPRPTPSTSATPTPTVDPAGAVVVACQGDAPAIRPATIDVTCADGGSALASITWSSWGGPSARGTGTLNRNTCSPNCATGKVVATRATVVLSDLTSGDGGALYRRLTVTPASGAVTTHALPA